MLVLELTLAWVPGTCWGATSLLNTLIMTFNDSIVVTAQCLLCPNRRNALYLVCICSRAEGSSIKHPRLMLALTAQSASRNMRRPWRFIKVDGRCPDEHLAVSKTFLLRRRTFVACRPRTIAAQASAAAVVAWLGNSVGEHPMLLQPNAAPAVIYEAQSHQKTFVPSRLQVAAVAPGYVSKLLLRFLCGREVELTRGERKSRRRGA